MIPVFAQYQTYGEWRRYFHMYISGKSDFLTVFMSSVKIPRLYKTRNSTIQGRVVYESNKFADPNELALNRLCSTGVFSLYSDDNYVGTGQVNEVVFELWRSHKDKNFLEEKYWQEATIERINGIKTSLINAFAYEPTYYQTTETIFEYKIVHRFINDYNKYRPVQIW